MILSNETFALTRRCSRVNRFQRYLSIDILFLRKSYNLGLPEMSNPWTGKFPFSSHDLQLALVVEPCTVDCDYCNARNWHVRKALKVCDEKDLACGRRFLWLKPNKAGWIASFNTWEKTCWVILPFLWMKRNKQHKTPTTTCVIQGTQAWTYEACVCQLAVWGSQ